MSRQLTEHRVNPANDQLKITVLDEPGHGGACHEYLIEGPDAFKQTTLLSFQNGPINTVGVNGITHEALLAVLVDRLRGFQSGPYECHHNQQALIALENAQNWLNRRTLERMYRGVEGTHEL